MAVIGTTHWDTVRVYGKFMRIDGTPSSGTIELAISNRVVSLADHIIWSGGEKKVVSLDAQGFFEVYMPASDDPDITPQGWSVAVTERLNGVTNPGTYQIIPRMEHAAAGFDISTLPPQTLPSGLPTVKLLGVAGGIALLSTDGKSVLDDVGNPIASSTGTVDLSGYALVSDVQSAYLTKTSAANLYATATQLGLKADQSALSNYATTASVMSALGAKVDQSAMSAYATAASVTSLAVRVTTLETSGGGGLPSGSATYDDATSTIVIAATGAGAATFDAATGNILIPT